MPKGGECVVSIDWVDEWCEEHGLAWANGYMKHARRRTWRNLTNGRWYALEGFVVRGNKSQRMVK